jgi:hypothetical protein
MKQKMLDHNTNISNNTLNSCVRMVIMKPLSASVLWVKSQLAHTRRIETNNGFFAFKPRVTVTTDKLESADAEKRQVLANNRAIRPRSGKLTDYTREFVTWVMRLQANYRIEQLTMWNVVYEGL